MNIIRLEKCNKLDENPNNNYISNDNLEFNIWAPSFFKNRPKYLPFKYIFYFIFLKIGIFRNYHYYSIFGKLEGEYACSLLVVPKYWKWPFMGKNDVQITYVMVNQNLRGKGLGFDLLNYTLLTLAKKPEIENIWYVADLDNTASIKLAKKCGFNIQNGFIDNYKSK